LLLISKTFPHGISVGVILLQNLMNYSYSHSVKRNKGGVLKFLILLLFAGIFAEMNAQQTLKPKGQLRSGMTEQDIGFHVFPNPSTGKFKVVLKDIDAPFDINVYNLIGQMIYHWESAGSPSADLEINLSKHPKGIYLVELDTEGLNMIKKVIIDHDKGG
jgi:hypothetical protein